jgi:hypothetical protein
MNPFQNPLSSARYSAFGAEMEIWNGFNGFNAEKIPCCSAAERGYALFVRG